MSLDQEDADVRSLSFFKNLLVDVCCLSPTSVSMFRRRKETTTNLKIKVVCPHQRFTFQCWHTTFLLCSFLVLLSMWRFSFYFRGGAVLQIPIEATRPFTPLEIKVLEYSVLFEAPEILAMSMGKKFLQMTEHATFTVEEVCESLLSDTSYEISFRKRAPRRGIYYSGHRMTRSYLRNMRSFLVALAEITAFAQRAVETVSQAEDFDYRLYLQLFVCVKKVLFICHYFRITDYLPELKEKLLRNESVRFGLRRCEWNCWHMTASKPHLVFLQSLLSYLFKLFVTFFRV